MSEHDVETPDSIQTRFGNEYVESQLTDAVVALATLVNAAAGLVNRIATLPLMSYIVIAFKTTAKYGGRVGES